MKQRDNISTYLGKDTGFEGNLKFNGTIRIDGRFRGEILGDGTLIVGEGARI
ncbi:MAG: polymer-forming cytoskeletal protein, partial [Candidatus Hodarchaeota archaeon]